jgi:hypothetical protein
MSERLTKEGLTAYFQQFELEGGRVQMRVEVLVDLVLGVQHEADRRVREVREELERPALSHGHLCRLSRVFNQAITLERSYDYEINEWLKRQIAAAKHFEEKAAHEQTGALAGPHFIHTCRCGMVLGQCRCPSPTKVRRVVAETCEACRGGG